MTTGTEIDFARIRAARRRRLFDAMADDSIDALILARPSNVAFASGARQLWTSGIRPWGPACVVVGATNRVHLLSTWDEGVPEEIPHEDLWGLSWNPAIIVFRVQSIPGLEGALRVATDGWSPGAEHLLKAVCPHAEIVDGGLVIARARSPKTSDELACLTGAATLAESALSAMIDALRPGVTERQLLAACVRHLGSLGAPVLPSEGVACATPLEGQVHLRRLASDRQVAAGELVVLNPAALLAGYQGTLARTWAVEGKPSAAQRALAERCQAAHVALIGCCRAGATGADLCRAWDATGESWPPEPLAWGIGLGTELPVIGHGLGEGAVLGAGTVLAVQSWVAAEGAGGVLQQDMVLVTDSDPQVLTRFGRGPVGGVSCSG